VRGAVWTLALAVGLLTRVASAQEADASTRMAARDLAMTGAEAFDEQDFATALDRFQRAESLYKVPSIAVMVARSLARVGRVVEAVDKYEETLRMPLDAAAPEAFQRAVAGAKAEVEVERARVARLELRLPADAPAGTELRLDGKLVPAALVGVPIPVDPGSHRVEARAPGRQPFGQELTLGEGGRQSLDVSLPFEQPAPAPVAPTRLAAERGAGPSTLTVVLLAGGAAAVAGGAVTGVVALNRRSKLDDVCTPGCPSGMRSDIQSFRLNRALSYIGFGLGAAAIGTGTYLLLHRGSAGEQVGALVLPAGAALTGTF
jgi:hypothetical protein